MIIITNKIGGSSTGSGSAKQRFEATDGQTKFIITDFTIDGTETVLAGGIGVNEVDYTFDYNDNSINFLVGQIEFTEIRILR